jgi:hypothetical protein
MTNMRDLVSKQEKRILERNVFPYPVDFEMANLGPEQTKPITLTGDAVDISSKGIGMWTTAPLMRGDVVKLYIPILSQNTILPSFSEVRWVEPGNSHNRVGLQFLA